jgi:hypothetical protein
MTYRERIGALVTAVALATGLASGSTHGAVKRTAAQKCAAAKRKLVGKEAAALTKCDAAAVTMGVAVDPTCETRAKTAFTAAWARAETAGGCITVAADANGNVFVADRFNNRIQKFTGTGTFLGKWESVGSADSQFSNPIALAVDGNLNVFVVDHFNNRIQKFTNTGTFLTKWGSLGLDEGQFSDAESIAVDADGNVFVADVDRIQKFTNAGAFVTEWGSLGSADGQFNSVLGVATNGNGAIYTTDFNHRVQKFACP